MRGFDGNVLFERIGEDCHEGSHLSVDHDHLHCIELLVYDGFDTFCSSNGCFLSSLVQIGREMPDRRLDSNLRRDSIRPCILRLVSVRMRKEQTRNIKSVLDRRKMPAKLGRQWSFVLIQMPLTNWKGLRAEQTPPSPKVRKSLGREMDTTLLAVLPSKRGRCQ